MKQFLFVLLLTFGMSTDVLFAKRSTYSKPKTSSTAKKSSGWGSSKKATPTKTKTTPTKTTPTKTTSSTAKKSSGWGSSKKATTTTKAKPLTKSQIQANKDAGAFKSMSSSSKYKKTDAMMTKNLGKSNKTYSSRAEAEKSTRAQMANKKYSYTNTTTAMQNRPSYVRETYVVNGHSYPTTYYGGRYGYYDSTGLFVAYAASHMLVTNEMLYHQGYRPVHTAPQQVTVHQAPRQRTSIWSFLIWIIVLLFAFGVIYLMFFHQTSTTTYTTSSSRIQEVDDVDEDNDNWT